MATSLKPRNAGAAQIWQFLNDPDIVIPDAKRAELENAMHLIESGAAEEITPPNIPSDEPIPGHSPEADRLRAENDGNLPRPDAEIIRPNGYRHGDAPSLDVPVNPLAASAQQDSMAAAAQVMAEAIRLAMAEQGKEQPPAEAPQPEVEPEPVEPREF